MTYYKITTPTKTIRATTAEGKVLKPLNIAGWDIYKLVWHCIVNDFRIEKTHIVKCEEELKPK